MTTEIDAEGLAATRWPPVKKALWDVLMAEKVNDGHYIKAFEFIEKLYAAYLSASRSTSEAEPVAWQWPEPNTGGFYVVVGSRPLEDLDRWQPLYAQPHPTPASDDQVEAVTDEMVRRAAEALDGLIDRKKVPSLLVGSDRELIARTALAAMGSTKP